MTTHPLLARMLRTALCAGAALLVQACATRPPARAFSDLPGKYLLNGDLVDVFETTGAATHGKLVELSAASLAVFSNDTRSEIAEERIVEIRRQSSQRGRFALAGLGVGFVIGVAAARASDSSGCSGCDVAAGGVNMLAGMAVGTGVGVLIGTLVKTHKTVYEAPRPVMPAPRRPPVPAIP